MENDTCIQKRRTWCVKTVFRFWEFIKPASQVSVLILEPIQTEPTPLKQSLVHPTG